MKRVLCVIMMLLSLLIGFQQAIIVVHFQLNQRAIERELCVNKENPELQCHGICVLKKRLKSAEIAEKASLGMSKKVEMLPVALPLLMVSTPLSDLPKIIVVYRERLYADPNREVSIPPPRICGELLG